MSSRNYEPHQNDGDFESFVARNLQPLSILKNSVPNDNFTSPQSALSLENYQQVQAGHCHEVNPRRNNDHANNRKNNPPIPPSPPPQVQPQEGLKIVKHTYSLKKPEHQFMGKYKLNK
jgi:hypothetical protein